MMQAPQLALTNHVPAVAVTHGGQALSSKIRRKGGLGCQRMPDRPRQSYAEPPKRM